MALSFTEGSIGGDIERASLSGIEAFYGGERVGRLEAAGVFPEPVGDRPPYPWPLV